MVSSRACHGQWRNDLSARCGSWKLGHGPNEARKRRMLTTTFEYQEKNLSVACVYEATD
jgi:hypothetical protein